MKSKWGYDITWQRELDGICTGNILWGIPQCLYKQVFAWSPAANLRRRWRVWTNGLHGWETFGEVSFPHYWCLSWFYYEVWAFRMFAWRGWQDCYIIDPITYIFDFSNGKLRFLLLTTTPLQALFLSKAKPGIFIPFHEHDITTYKVPKPSLKSVTKTENNKTNLQSAISAQRGLSRIKQLNVFFSVNSIAHVRLSTIDALPDHTILYFGVI